MVKPDSLCIDALSQAFRDNPELLEVLVQRAGMDLMQLDDGEEAGGAAPVDCRVS